MLLDYFEQLNTKETLSSGVQDYPMPRRSGQNPLPLPPNVTLFSKHETGVIPVQRGGRTICTVVGRSSDGQQVLHVPSYRVEATNDYTVAVGYGSSDADALAEGRLITGLWEVNTTTLKLMVEQKQRRSTAEHRRAGHCQNAVRMATYQLMSMVTGRPEFIVSSQTCFDTATSSWMPMQSLLLWVTSEICWGNGLDACSMRTAGVTC